MYYVPTSIYHNQPNKFLFLELTEQSATSSTTPLECYGLVNNLATAILETNVMT